MEILLQLIFLIVGFAMLVKGADWFVDGSAEMAAKFKIPQMVIGLTIVAMGKAPRGGSQHFSSFKRERRYYNRKHCGK